MSQAAHIIYKATDFYAPDHERTILWNDHALKIDWQLDGPAVVSAKDQIGLSFLHAEKFD